MEPVEPDEAATAVMDDEVTAAEAAVEGVTKPTAHMKAMTASVATAMTTTVTSSMATTMPTAAAGIGDLGKADDGGNKQS
jgi:hypothetical protein